MRSTGFLSKSLFTNHQLWKSYMVIAGIGLVNLLLFLYFTRFTGNNGTHNTVLSPGAYRQVQDLLLQLDGIHSGVEQQVRLHESLLRALHGEEASLIRDILRRWGKLPPDLDTNSSAVDRLLKLPLFTGDDIVAKAVDLPDAPRTTNIALLMIACNRVTVRRSLDQIFKYRPESMSGVRFPVIVSQDCDHKPTSDVIDSYGQKLTHINQPDHTPFNLPRAKLRFQGYYQIARHYKWALDQVFFHFNYTSVLIVEDDLDIAPDFFEYFAATYPILLRDPTLFCVSAWNDNGMSKHISNEPELLYRTDFFPGLGWMMLRSTWIEIRNEWPITFWDEFMRQPNIRRERACIRPEISRSSTFGRKGVSNGQFFDTHLRYIQLNNRYVPFTHLDMSYLSGPAYDTLWRRKVYQEAKAVSLSDVMSGAAATKAAQESALAVRIEYTTKKEFVNAAHQLGIMEDLKAGVPRTAYRGVVPLMKSGLRVYLAPPVNWNSYDTTWT